MIRNANVLPVLRRIARRSARVLGRACLAAVLIGMTAWAALAVCFADLSRASPRYVPGASVVLLTAAAVVLVRPRRLKWAAPLPVFAVVLGWYLSRQASNDRDWRYDVARVASADVSGDRLVVHNVRNFAFWSGTEAVPAWEDRGYDLSRLKTVDLILCYWGSKSVAHAIASFGFDDGQFLAVSIETRLEKDEVQSGLQSLFRQYELIYVFADERDVVRVRTNHRAQDVYLYRTRLSPAQAGAVLVSYLARANSLAREPEWYNTLTANCTTSVLPHARAAGAPGRMSLDVLLSGRAARQGYANGMLNTRVPFEELESRSLINAAALAAENDPDFSKRIRAGLPLE
jgi:hypothetical protein